MGNKVHFEREGFEKILSSLKEKTQKLEQIYSEVEEKSKEISGESETWKGKAQDEYYKCYKTIAKRFSKIEKNFNESNKFLQATIESYYKEDEANKSAQEKNKENLSLN